MKKQNNKLLPGGDLVEQGLADLEQHRITESSLLVLIAAPRLRRLGIKIKEQPCSQPYEHELYARLEERLGPGAHSHYNSLLKRMASYASALEREQSELHAKPLS